MDPYESEYLDLYLWGPHWADYGKDLRSHPRNNTPQERPRYQFGKRTWAEKPQNPGKRKTNKRRKGR